jgi:hypothetical protein
VSRQREAATLINAPPSMSMLPSTKSGLKAMPSAPTSACATLRTLFPFN